MKNNQVFIKIKIGSIKMFMLKKQTLLLHTNSKKNYNLTKEWFYIKYNKKILNLE
jgi:hypothetical protein